MVPPSRAPAQLIEIMKLIITGTSEMTDKITDKMTIKIAIKSQGHRSILKGRASISDAHLQHTWPVGTILKVAV